MRKKKSRSSAKIILKPEFEETSRDIFRNIKIKITTLKERHLAVVIGSENYQKKYISNTVSTWKEKK